MAGMNTWALNTSPLNSEGGEGFIGIPFPGGVVATIGQEVQYTAPVSQPVVCRQRVGVVFSGVAVTVTQDVRLRSVFPTGNVVQFGQDVQLTREGGNCAVLRQWVEE